MKWLWALLVLVACTRSGQERPQLVSLHVVDESGMVQNIGSEERVKRFAAVDFSKPQPYSRVLRVFSPKEDGTIPAILTSYWPSGTIRQWLDISSHRAQGRYLEWHENGQCRIVARVVNGSPEFSETAMATWVFDGPTKVWDDKGRVVASMQYLLGQLDGVVERFDESGQLLEQEHYILGKREGKARRYWKGQLFAEEIFHLDQLVEASYPQGAVHMGEGISVQPTEKGYIMREVSAGRLEGRVAEYEMGQLVHEWHQVAGKKEGIETFFAEGKPVLEIPYVAGRVQGEVKTHYLDGAIESVRAMSNNSKEGLLRCWYPDGQIALVEEYREDRLVSGQYYALGNLQPVSSVIAGEGESHIFDRNGQLQRRFSYSDGLPQE